MNYISFPVVDAKMEGLDDVVFPNMVKIRQIYDSMEIENVPQYLYNALQQQTDKFGSLENKKICLTAGSRGIPFYYEITKTIIEWLKEKGAKPFIVPAMGSHAFATAAGQRDMLAGFGITEDSVGCPILSSMETVIVGELKDGTPVYCDKYAYQSDGIVVLNKIKPHTSFKGPHESGLLKMLCIGLGKHKGAATMHRKGYENFHWLVEEAGKVCLEKEPVLFAVGVVQNAYDKISELEVIEKEKIVDRDRELLKVAKEKLAKFKFSKTDVLIIDQIGKNLGGAGFDPNVVARKDRIYPGTLISQNIFVRGLTEATHHNASGIGTIDVTTLRCVNDVDWAATWTNMMTANFLPGCRIPCFAKNDEQALKWAIRTCTGIDYSDARVVWIKDTMHMSEIKVSENLARELSTRDDIEILSNPEPIHFGQDGYIIE